MVTINSCRACQGKNIQPFFDLGSQPLANSLLKSPHEKEKSYPLSLDWCPDCNLVQLHQTVDPKELFLNYVWVTGTSPSTRKYAQKFFQKVISRFLPECEPKTIPECLGGLGQNRGKVLEVGSNDGTFLLPFIKAGFKVLGIDPAKNIAQEANQNGIPTKDWFFGPKTAKKILKEFGPAEIVFTRNTLPHVANLRSFVKGLSLCLADKGLLVIEAHYAGTILKDLHYDSIYHEHLHYFSLKSLERLLNKFGLFIFDLGESHISGGSIVVYARKDKTKETTKTRQYRARELADKTSDFASWKKFAQRAFKHRQRLLELLTAAEKKGRVIGYGASARSSTMLNFCGINSGRLSVIADLNPLKQGRYTAGTHILIESPQLVMEQRPKSVLLLAWNFAEEIRAYLKKRFGYQGTFIIPLPRQPRIE